jgi:adenylosuccinate lyase
MLLYYMLIKMIEVIDGLVVNKDNIANNLNRTHGLIYSQRALLKLVECGLTREEAYKAVQDNAMKSWKTGEEFKKLLMADKLISSKIKKSDIEDIFDPKKVFKNVNYIFKNAGLT